MLHCSFMPPYHISLQVIPAAICTGKLSEVSLNFQGYVVKEDRAPHRWIRVVTLVAFVLPR
jgi:uncharacterized membrane protein YoaK (UPF0700 family)